jgi:hypothetical protein
MSTNGIEHESIKTREIKPRNPQDPTATTLYKGQFYTSEEAEELRRREIAAFETKDDRERWEKSEAGQLCLAFYEAFQAYRRYMEEHRGAIYTPYGWRVDYDEHKLFEAGLKVMEQDRREREETARKNLEKAQRAARCQHMHLNGEQCGAPRVRGKKLCHMHERMEQSKAESENLATMINAWSMEDPDTIQAAIQGLQRAIMGGKLTTAQVGQLAYTIQLAAWNVTRTSWMQEE